MSVTESKDFEESVCVPVCVYILVCVFRDGVRQMWNAKDWGVWGERYLGILHTILKTLSLKLFQKLKVKKI